VDDAQLVKVPDRGPLIMVTNHANFLEPPLLYTHLTPRPLAGLAKAETWDNPILRFLANLSGGIPLHRGEADISAMRAALRALAEGRILGVAPEGTRSGDGCLQRGNPGVVFLALHCGAPLLPVACCGTERFWKNLRALRRTEVRFVVGQPFSLHTDGTQVTRQARQEMTDEIMYELARLLPPSKRGAYADMSQATTTHLRFALPPGALADHVPSTRQQASNANRQASTSP
jgi:1-acyl-sn-glycerol-3-phosphate acyltransferase